MQVIKCPNCGSNAVEQISDEKYQCLGCDNVFLIHRYSKEFRETDEHIEEIRKDLKESISKNNGGYTEENYIKRALLCIEDKNYTKAAEMLELALNINPENAEIYAIQLMIDFSVQDVNELSSYVDYILEKSNFKKMLRFSQDSENVVADAVKSLTYEVLIKKYESKDNTENALKNLLEVFQLYNGYKNSTDVCRDISTRLESIASAKIEEIYQDACSKIYASYFTVHDINNLIEVFQGLNGYKDSIYKIEECKTQIEKKKVSNRKKIKNFIKVSLIFAIILLFYRMIILPIVDNKRAKENYEVAVEAESKENLYEALTYYRLAVTYKDSEDKVKEISDEIDRYYELAMEKFYLEEYFGAYQLFQIIEGHEDVSFYMEMAIDNVEELYETGLQFYKEKQYENARGCFEKIIGYEDAETYYKNCNDCDMVGHTWESGRKCDVKCVRCGEVKGECIPDPVSSCTEAQYCTVCNSILKDVVGHDYSNATCTEESVCKVCGETVLAAKGHSYDKEGTCFECGHQYCCECIIDELSTEYISSYDDYYNGDDEKSNLGYVVLKESLKNKGQVKLWANVYIAGEDEPEYEAVIFLFDEKTTEFPIVVSPFYSASKYSVEKIVYGISFGW